VLGKPGTQVGFVRIALALFALFATLIPDARTLHAGWRGNALLAYTTSDPESSRPARGFASALTLFEEAEDDPEGDGSRLSLGLRSSWRDDGGLPSADLGWAIPKRRASAHKATGPPSL
jgi:hypothetical protein